MMSYVEQLFSLKGKVALVSGASRGIGEAIAHGLVQAGAVVVGMGRSPAPTQASRQNFVYRRCDVLDRAAFRKLCEDMWSEHEHLDTYVHAAGTTLINTDRSSLAETFRRTIDTNLTAAYDCCLAVSEHMAKHNGGSIINITSIGSILGFPSNPGYVASKGGLRMLTKAMALDLGAQHIRVNNISPGYIRTAMTETSFHDPVCHQERLHRMIIQRWGTPEDLVGAAIFLASEASSYITGQDILVDGGWTAKGL